MATGRAEKDRGVARGLGKRASINIQGRAMRGPDPVTAMGRVSTQAKARGRATVRPQGSAAVAAARLEDTAAVQTPAKAAEDAADNSRNAEFRMQKADSVSIG